MKQTTATLATIRLSSRLIIALLLAMAGVGHSVRAQTLLHRYTFDSDATDSVGGADGALVGDASFAGGAAVLTGNKPCYIDLPNDLTANLTNYTIESWVTWDGGPAWQRIWDFGNSAQGEDVQGQADSSLWISPSDAGNNLGSYFKASGQAFVPVTKGPRLTPGYLHQVDVTYDQANGTARLFVDAEQVGVTTNFVGTFSDIGFTFNNWIGHSQYAADPDFEGSISEFRIYDGALDSAAVAANFASGPGMAGRGILVSIRLDAQPMSLGQAQLLRVAANFENVSNLEITGDSQISYEVSDTSVFTVTTNGVLTSVGSTDASATVSVIYQGQTNSQVVQVTAPVLLHRYSFTTDASDSTGGADGALVGGATISNNAVVLNGINPSYVDLPNDLAISLTNATIEAWVQWNGGANWQRVWDFGNSAQGEDVQGQADNAIWVNPADANGALGSYYKPHGSGRATIATAGALSTGFLHQIVWTYDKPSTTARLFLDGAEVAENTQFFTSLADLGSTVNNWLGHSQYSTDPDLNGSIDEFRIYDGSLSPAGVTANFQNGPALTGRGNLVALRLLAQTNMVSGNFQQLRVAADFETAANLEVTTDPQLAYQVSDPSVFAISPSGLLTSIGTSDASAVVSAIYLGQTNSVLVQVTVPAPPPATLAHRYSFTTDASDSVGSADGTLVGGAVVANQQLALSGVKPSYLDLPNGLFSTLTNYTIETWVNWHGGANWQRICDFGNNTAGEGAQGTGTNSFFLTPKAAAGAGAGFTGTAAWLYTAQGSRTNIARTASITVSNEHHLVVTYARASATATMYLDGSPVSTNRNVLTSLADFGVTLNNWLGHSQFSADPDFNGTINEFRIYDGVLSAQSVQADFAVGPDTLVGPPLSITRSGGQILIRWPADASGFALESSAALGAGASWSAVALTPTQTNGLNQVAITPGPGALFYRLRK